MIEPPQTEYAKSGDVHIAYQVVGTGPPDIITVAGWLTHLDVFWEEPGFARIPERIRTFARFITLDKRNVGLSDRIAGDAPQPLEGRIDDIRAVMDAAGSSSATILAIHEAGPLAILFAATYPERVDSLILYGTWPKGTRSADYPWAPPSEYHERVQQAIDQRWGTGMSARIMSPSRANDESLRKWFARYERLGASPGTAKVSARISAETDVRDILPSVTVPTLIVHRIDDQVADIGGARYMAERIPGARLVELEGADHHFGTDPDQILDVIESFVTGRTPAEHADRVLATVLFTDVVGSTTRAAQHGDAQWRRVLDQHDAVTAAEVERFRGRLVKSTGDGSLATFDGPARAVQCARAISDRVRSLGIEVRCGLHTGEIETRGEDVSGIAVHIAQRVQSLASPGEVLVSRTVPDLVAGSGLEFDDRGEHELKGVPGHWQIYAVRT